MSTYLKDMKEMDDDFKGANIYDCSAGSGISSLRMMMELEDGLVQKIISNDENKNFSDYLNLMVEYNSLKRNNVNKLSSMIIIFLFELIFIEYIILQICIIFFPP